MTTLETILAQKGLTPATPPATPSTLPSLAPGELPKQPAQAHTIDKYLTTTTNQKASVLIYGDAISGKTTGSRTFPNPYIVDFDNNMPAGVERVIPMWDDAFVDKIAPRRVPKVANRKDALLIVLADLAREIPADATVIIDSLSRVEHWYNIQELYEPKPVSAKTGKEDTMKLFRTRLDYFLTLFTQFTSAKCNVVFIAHAQRARDDDGDLTMQLKPALQGQIGDKLPQFFTSVLQTNRRLREGSKTGEVEFLWRVRPSAFEPARVPKPVAVDFIPQQYSELVKYL